MHTIYKLVGLILICCILLTGLSVGYQMLKRQNEIISHKQAVIDSLKNRAIDISVHFGESLFVNNCNSCHLGKRSTDNMLDGIVDRLGERYLTLYITKQDSLIEAKDEYAVQLKVAYDNKANCHNYKFSKPEMEAIISFLK